MALPIKVNWERHFYDEDSISWAAARVPKPDINVRPEQVGSLPLPDVRLILFSGAQLLQIDPCPNDWFSMDLNELKKLAVRI